jgi:hypothetical protein
MSLVSIEVDDSTLKWLEGLPDRIDYGVQEAVDNSSWWIAGDIARSLLRAPFPYHPYRYPNPKTGKPYTPAGETPTILYGGLMSSIWPGRWTRVGFAHYERLPGTHDLVYARMQEDGFAMFGVPSRPYVEPARRRFLDSGQLASIWSSAIERMLRA